MASNSSSKDDVDYTSIFTYMPLFVYLWMLCVTIFFTLEDHKLVAPISVISTVILLISIYSLHSLWKFANRGMDVYPAMICWTFWLVYGMIFKGTGNEIPEVFPVVSAVFLLILVASLYKPGLYDNPVLRVIAIVSYSFFALMFPNEESISTDCGTLWVVFKASLFYFLYVVSLSERKIMATIWLHAKRASQGGVTKENTRSFGGEKMFYNSVERTVLQSAWVLFVKWYFVVFAIVAIAGTLTWIKRHSEVYTLYKKKDTVTRKTKDIEIGVQGAKFSPDSENEVSIEEKDIDAEDVIINDVSEYAESDEESSKIVIKEV